MKEIPSHKHISNSSYLLGFLIRYFLNSSSNLSCWIEWNEGKLTLWNSRGCPNLVYGGNSAFEVKILFLIWSIKKAKHHFICQNLALAITKVAINCGSDLECQLLKNKNYLLITEEHVKMEH